MNREPDVGGVAHLFGIEGAAEASGPTAVVDTFRAFTTAAYLLDAGASDIMLASELDQAREMASRHNGSLLCGEDQGRRPADFDLGNSPGEVLDRTDIDGATIVMRTSGGTRCVLAAIGAGASPVFGASLVVASATARNLPAGSSAIVAAGRNGTLPVIEDDETARVIAAAISGVTLPPDLDLIRASESAERLRIERWAHPDDLELCLRHDLFDFALPAEQRGGVVHLGRLAAKF